MHVGQAALIYAINLCHIAPWEATEGLLRAATLLLRRRPDGRLVIYGPFKVDNQFTVPVPILRFSSCPSCHEPATRRRRRTATPRAAVTVHNFRRRRQTDSNREFDASLRGRNPLWGYRDIAELRAAASAAGGGAGGLELERVVPMPANNFILVFSPATPATGA